MEENNSGSRTHEISFQNREQGSISGVRDVVSFDEQVVVLDTDYGTVTVKGEELHVSRLDLDAGEVELKGSLDSIGYSKKGSPGIKNKEPVLGRLFK